MPKEIHRRLSRLEAGDAGERLITVIGPEDLDVDETLEQRGISARAADIIICVRKPTGAPVRVAVDGVSI